MNASLNKAKVAKDDEFYTLMEDVEQELIHYKEFLEGKVVYCNCDNPDKSNFYKYLKAHFSEYKPEGLLLLSIPLSLRFHYSGHRKVIILHML